MPLELLQNVLSFKQLPLCQWGERGNSTVRKRLSNLLTLGRECQPLSRRGERVASLSVVDAELVGDPHRSFPVSSSDERPRVRSRNSNPWHFSVGI
jgi:hypothetical protein